MSTIENLKTFGKDPSFAYSIATVYATTTANMHKDIHSGGLLVGHQIQETWSRSRYQISNRTSTNCDM